MEVLLLDGGCGTCCCYCPAKQKVPSSKQSSKDMASRLSVSNGGMPRVDWESMLSKSIKCSLLAKYVICKGDGGIEIGDELDEGEGDWGGSEQQELTPNATKNDGLSGIEDEDYGYEWRLTVGMKKNYGDGGYRRREHGVDGGGE
ncbi:uncharacterized protein G2W53_004489 [Senna tora]|uniref:Uncharacterized protein n=1 Tax=Senna tora TaxID=362788 RepID=A0A835CI43_9FABA|nr:uncharacterized protein G2W53_004489 [Senna tora]